ncbi:MAG: phosphoribosylformylglycinamidine synthase subunit PurL, partial [Methanosarcinales archaeon]
MIYKKADVPFELFYIDFRKADDDTLRQISKERGVALNLDNMRNIKAYYSKLDRAATDVEFETFGQVRSEHCLHPTFKGIIEYSENGKTENINSLLKTYIMQPTEELNFSWVLDVFKDNAGIVHFEGNYGIAFKVETHNHPSQIEPYGGAATGIGGVIRDPLGVGSDKPFFNTDVLCFGPLDLSYEKLPDGIKHPRYIFEGVVSGIASYGNNMGIPTVNGAIYFDDSYIGNVVVYCGSGGLVPMDKRVKNTKSGEVAILIGGKTGRDGIHGVTFASEELNAKSEETSRPAVQVPNPIEEEKICRGLEIIRDLEYYTAITDLGGGGLSCAITEMAYNSGLGVEVELDKVPLKQTKMPPWEIWESESQERMLVSAQKERANKIIEVFEDEDVEATVVGVFTKTGKVRINYQGYTVADLDLEFLYNPPKIIRAAEWKTKTFPEPNIPDIDNKNYTEDLLKLLSQPNICSKEYVIRKYDHNVQGNTVLNPLQGFYFGPGDAAILKPLYNSWKGVVVSSGMNPNYGKIDPYWMAFNSISEAVANNVAVGGRRIAILDNFTWGNPEKPDRLGSLVRACKGCYDGAKLFEVPFISGKDSLYNESPLGPVTPTLLISAVGIIPDIRKSVSMDLKSAEDKIYIIGCTYSELGGSEYYKTKGFLGNKVPKVRKNAKRNVDAVTEAIDKGYVRACHDVSEGGIGVAAAEMA